MIYILNARNALDWLVSRLKLALTAPGTSWKMLMRYMRNAMGHMDGGAAVRFVLAELQARHMKHGAFLEHHVEMRARNRSFVVDVTTAAGQAAMHRLFGQGENGTAELVHVNKGQQKFNLPRHPGCIPREWINASAAKHRDLEALVVQALMDKWPTAFHPLTLDRLLSSGVCGCRSGYVAV
jgi:hypothetical protein